MAIWWGTKRSDKRSSASALAGARGVGVVGAAVVVTLTAGCTGIPADDSWQPPTWTAESAGVVTVLGDAQQSATSVDDIAQIDTAGLVDGRIRNDAAELQARYVQLHEGAAFNQRVVGIIDAAIADTGVAKFTPEVFGVDAGLAERGCTTGASTLPAAELLAAPELGPRGGVGTAVVCEVTAAFGPTLAVTFRTVAGDSDEVTRDQAVTLYADLESGAVVDGGELWIADAAAELWQQTLSALRRDAGGLSLAPFSAPDEEQLVLAAAALQAPVFTEAGVTLTLPAGFTSPETAGLGMPVTTEPLNISVADFEDWLSPAGEALLAQREAPFVGVPDWNGANPVNCSIEACVAVTYDDGPTAFTPKLLDTFQAHESSATLFLLGNSVLMSPDTVARASAEGHELASHTMTHPELTAVSKSKARSEVHDAAAAITDITGLPVTMYRPPYGAVDDGVIEAVGMPAIMWSIDTLDWEDPGPAALMERAVDAAVPGDIILFHDTHSDSVDTAADILEGLKNRGFTPVTITDLFDGNVPEGRVTSR